MDLRLPTCVKAGRLLQDYCLRFQPLNLFLSSWNVIPILLPCSTLLAMLLCLASYEHCSTQLLKVLHKCCSMAMLRVLLIYPHSPLGAAHPRDCVYISVKPLSAVLQPINVRMYIPTAYVCTYYVPYNQNILSISKFLIKYNFSWFNFRGYALVSIITLPHMLNIM